MTDPKRGSLTFVRDEWDDTFPFDCGYSYSAWTPVGTQYSVWWGTGPVSDDAESRVTYGDDGHHPSLSMSAYKALVATYGEPGTGAHWAASYRFMDRNGLEVQAEVCQEQTLEDAMKACLTSYRQHLMWAMAQEGVVVVGLPLLPPEDSPEFRQEDVDNWTPAHA